MTAPAVRTACADDVAEVAELAARTMRETYASDHDADQIERHIAEHLTPERIAAELADPAMTTLIAGAGEDPAGYAILRVGAAPACVIGPAPIELARIYVRRAMIRTGVGSALMRAVLREAVRRDRETVWLSVWERNDRARAFYRRWAFREVGTTTFVFGGVGYEDFVLARPVSGGGAP